jgi:hypothetical protein
MMLWRWHLLSYHIVLYNLIEFCDIRMILIENFARVHAIDLKTAKSLKRAP